MFCTRVTNATFLSLNGKCISDKMLTLRCGAFLSPGNLYKT